MDKSITESVITELVNDESVNHWLKWISTLALKSDRAFISQTLLNNKQKTLSTLLFDPKLILNTFSSWSISLCLCVNIWNSFRRHGYGNDGLLSKRGQADATSHFRLRPVAQATEIIFRDYFWFVCVLCISKTLKIVYAHNSFANIFLIHCD